MAISIVDASTLIENERCNSTERCKHIEVLLDLLDRAGRKQLLQPHDLFLYHKRMFPFGGAIRTTHAHATGSLHEYLEPQLIWKNLQALCDSLQKPTNWEQLASAHWCLCFIHPFSDGNGRMARLFTCYQAVLNGYGAPKLGPQRNLYLQLLETKDITGLARLLQSSETRLR